MKKSFLKDAVFYLLLIAVVLGAAIGIQRACFSKKKFKNLSYSFEIRLKGLFKSLIEKDAAVIQHSYLNEAAEKIKRRLTEHLEKNPYTIEVLIVKSPVVNAFAFPGGLIVVYTGLIEKIENAAVFASLLAHEMGHIVRRDSLKALVRQLGLTALLTLGGGDSTAFIREIFKLLINNSFSRKQEEKADRFAAELLIKAGINPGHFASFLSRLRKGEGDSEGIGLYLNTHPDINSRIRAAGKMAHRFSGEEKPFAVDWQRAKYSLSASGN